MIEYYVGDKKIFVRILISNRIFDENLLLTSCSSKIVISSTFLLVIFVADKNVNGLFVLTN
jgi:hypothetical protein